LNEASNLTVSLQNDILNAVDSGSYDCRYIVSSSKKLEPIVKKGGVLKEFFQKLCVVQITLPSLRERKDDIELLIKEFVHQLSQTDQPHTISKSAVKKLVSRSWPGNVSELRNSIQYAITHAKKEMITEEDLPLWANLSYYSLVSGESLSDELYKISCELMEFAKVNGKYAVLEEYKKLVLAPLIEAALVQTDHNKSDAAKLLGINRNTLRKYLNDYDMNE
jgi:DNA-binding NtrC family response regulator